MLLQNKTARMQVKCFWVAARLTDLIYSLINSEMKRPNLSFLFLLSEKSRPPQTHMNNPRDGMDIVPVVLLLCPPIFWRCDLGRPCKIEIVACLLW